MFTCQIILCSGQVNRRNAITIRKQKIKTGRNDRAFHFMRSKSQILQIELIACFM